MTHTSVETPAFPLARFLSYGIGVAVYRHGDCRRDSTSISGSGMPVSLTHLTPTTNKKVKDMVVHLTLKKHNVDLDYTYLFNIFR